MKSNSYHLKSVALTLVLTFSVTSTIAYGDSSVIAESLKNHFSTVGVHPVLNQPGAIADLVPTIARGQLKIKLPAKSTRSELRKDIFDITVPDSDVIQELSHARFGRWTTGLGADQIVLIDDRNRFVVKFLVPNVILSNDEFKQLPFSGVFKFIFWIGRTYFNKPILIFLKRKIKSIIRLMLKHPVTSPNNPEAPDGYQIAEEHFPEHPIRFRVLPAQKLSILKNTPWILRNTVLDSSPWIIQEYMPQDWFLIERLRAAIKKDRLDQAKSMIEKSVHYLASLSDKGIYDTDAGIQIGQNLVITDAGQYDLIDWGSVTDDPQAMKEFLVNKHDQIKEIDDWRARFPKKSLRQVIHELSYERNELSQNLIFHLKVSDVPEDVLEELAEFFLAQIRDKLVLRHLGSVVESSTGRALITAGSVAQAAGQRSELRAESAGQPDAKNADNQNVKIREKLELIDAAVTEEKIDYLFGLVEHFRGIVQPRYEDLMSGDDYSKKVQAISQEVTTFTSQQIKNKDLAHLRDYVRFEIYSIIPLGKDIFATSVRINRKNVILVINHVHQKDNFNLFLSSEDVELKKMKARSKSFIKRKFQGKDNQAKRREWYSRVDDFFPKNDDRASIKEIITQLAGVSSDHPDLPIPQLHMEGPNSAAAPQLAQKVPTRLSDSKQPANLSTDQQKPKEEKLTSDENAQRYLLKPIEALIRRDERGQLRQLTPEEMVQMFEMAMEHVTQSEGVKEDKKVQLFSTKILDALRAGEFNFEFNPKFDPHSKEELSNFWGMDSVSFPEIQEDVKNRIYTAATIPRDGKTWVFMFYDQHYYQAAYLLTRLLGIDQKMVLVYPPQRKHGYYHEEKSLIHDVIRDAYESIQPIKEVISETEKQLNYHNRFLEKLHYSYRVDKGFKNEIDELRQVIFDQVNPEPGESFRFITGDFEMAFALEFAARTGPHPITADPYVAGYFDNVAKQKKWAERNNPHYFLFGSSLFDQHKKIFQGKHYFLMDAMHDRTFAFLDSSVLSGKSYLRQALRQIFTYNEAVRFLNEESNRQATQTWIDPPKVTGFTIPGSDFTRPDEQRSLSHLSPTQLFQMVEGFKKEDWFSQKESVLKRYAELAAENQIKSNPFLNHLIALFKHEFFGHWYEGMNHGNKLQKAIMTRAVMETVFRSSPKSLLDDEFIEQFYSGWAKRKKDNTYEYSEPGNRGEKARKISEEDGINALTGYEDYQPLGQIPLCILAILIELSPERIGPRAMNFFTAMANAASDRYGIMFFDTEGWEENSYGIAPWFDLPFNAFDFHPQYFAKRLLESPRTPNVIQFLLRPAEEGGRKPWYYHGNAGVGESDREDAPIISEAVTTEMVRQNNLDEQQLKILEILSTKISNVVSETILENWKKVGIGRINQLLGIKQMVNESVLVQMENLYKEHGFRNHATALFLAQHPNFEIEQAKNLDQLFQGDSVQVIFEILEAVRRNQWAFKEVNRLYKTNLWSGASPAVRHKRISEVLKLDSETREKLFTFLAGKTLQAQNLFDIYPLNLPENHPLHEKYRHELKYYDMAYSSFVLEGDLLKNVESDDSLALRVSHRASFLLSNLSAISKYPQEELARRMLILQEFETKKAEIDNTGYRLLLVVSNEHFDELFKVLEDNFDSLKRLSAAKKEIKGYMQSLAEVNPSLAMKSQKQVVAWAAAQLGIDSRRRFQGNNGESFIQKQFRSALKNEGFGGRVTAEDQASEKEVNELKALVISQKLLLAIAKNLKLYRAWLEDIPDIETDPAYMLPAVSLRSELRQSELTSQEINERMKQDGFPELELLWSQFKSLRIWKGWKRVPLGLDDINEVKLERQRNNHIGPLIASKAWLIPILVSAGLGGYALFTIVFKFGISVADSLARGVPWAHIISYVSSDLPDFHRISAWVELVMTSAGCAGVFYIVAAMIKKTWIYSWRTIGALDLALMLRQRNYREWFDKTAKALKVMARLTALGINDNWDNPNYRILYHQGYDASVQSVQEFIHGILRDVLGTKEGNKAVPGKYKSSLQARKKQTKKHGAVDSIDETISQFVEAHREELPKSRRGELPPESGKQLLQDLLDHYLVPGSAGHAYVLQSIQKINDWANLPEGIVEAQIWQRDPWVDLTRPTDFYSSASLRSDRFMERINRRSRGVLGAFGYLRSKTVSALDFKTSKGRRVRARIAAAVYKDKDGIEKPILFVDGVEGRSDIKPQLIQRAIEDYAKASGFQAVFYFAYPLNLIPRRFAKFLADSGMKMVEEHIEYADSSERQYLDAYGYPVESFEYAFPKGNALGYVTDLSPESNRNIRYPSEWKKAWVEIRKKDLLKIMALFTTFIMGMFTIKYATYATLIPLSILIGSMLVYQFYSYRKGSVDRPKRKTKTRSELRSPDEKREVVLQILLNPDPKRMMEQFGSDQAMGEFVRIANDLTVETLEKLLKDEKPIKKEEQAPIPYGQARKISVFFKQLDDMQLLPQFIHKTYERLLINLDQLFVKSGEFLDVASTGKERTVVNMVRILFESEAGIVEGLISDDQETRMEAYFDMPYSLDDADSFRKHVIDSEFLTAFHYFIVDHTKETDIETSAKALGILCGVADALDYKIPHHIIPYYQKAVASQDLVARRIAAAFFSQFSKEGISDSPEVLWHLNELVNNAEELDETRSDALEALKRNAAAAQPTLFMFRPDLEQNALSEYGWPEEMSRHFRGIFFQILESKTGILVKDYNDTNFNLVSVIDYIMNRFDANESKPLDPEHVPLIPVASLVRYSEQVSDIKISVAQAREVIEKTKQVVSGYSDPLSGVDNDLAELGKLLFAIQWVLETGKFVTGQNRSLFYRDRIPVPHSLFNSTDYELLRGSLEKLIREQKPSEDTEKEEQVAQLRIYLEQLDAIYQELLEYGTHEYDEVREKLSALQKLVSLDVKVDTDNTLRYLAADFVLSTFTPRSELRLSPTGSSTFRHSAPAAPRSELREDDGKYFEIAVVVKNAEGVHARPVMSIYEMAQYAADHGISIKVRNASVGATEWSDATEPMSLMLLEGYKGTQLNFRFEFSTPEAKTLAERIAVALREMIEELLFGDEGRSFPGSTALIESTLQVPEDQLSARFAALNFQSGAKSELRQSDRIGTVPDADAAHQRSELRTKGGGSRFSLPSASAAPHASHAPFNVNDLASAEPATLRLARNRESALRLRGVTTNRAKSVSTRLNKSGRRDSSQRFRMFDLLSGQAISQLENITNEIEKQILLDGFLKATLHVIQLFDPVTYGHTIRVTRLTMALARALQGSKSQKYGGYVFSPMEFRQLYFAAIFHDVGKIGVHSEIIQKMNKLYPHEYQSIMNRLELIRHQIFIRLLERELALTIPFGLYAVADLIQSEQEIAEKVVRELNHIREVIETANKPSVLAEDVSNELKELGKRWWLDENEVQQPILTEHEIESLSISRGSLTQAERSEIESHVAKSLEILQLIPWPVDFKQIVKIAGDHHETLNGTGYPNHLKGDQILLESRIMTIADIYDALTAKDRPYKKALPHEKAIEILQDEANRGRIDADLLQIFIESEAFQAVNNFSPDEEINDIPHVDLSDPTLRSELRNADLLKPKRVTKATYKALWRKILAEIDNFDDLFTLNFYVSNLLRWSDMETLSRYLYSWFINHKAGRLQSMQERLRSKFPKFYTDLVTIRKHLSTDDIMTIMAKRGVQIAYPGAEFSVETAIRVWFERDLWTHNLFGQNASLAIEYFKDRSDIFDALYSDEATTKEYTNNEDGPRSELRSSLSAMSTARDENRPDFRSELRGVRKFILPFLLSGLIGAGCVRPDDQQATQAQEKALKQAEKASDISYDLEMTNRIVNTLLPLKGKEKREGYKNLVKRGIVPERIQRMVIQAFLALLDFSMKELPPGSGVTRNWGLFGHLEYLLAMDDENSLYMASPKVLLSEFSQALNTKSEESKKVKLQIEILDLLEYLWVYKQDEQALKMIQKALNHPEPEVAALAAQYMDNEAWNEREEKEWAVNRKITTTMPSQDSKVQLNSLNPRSELRHEFKLSSKATFTWLEVPSGDWAPDLDRDLLQSLSRFDALKRVILIAEARQLGAPEGAHVEILERRRLAIRYLNREIGSLIGISNFRITHQFNNRWQYPKWPMITVALAHILRVDPVWFLEGQPLSEALQNISIHKRSVLLRHRQNLSTQRLASELQKKYGQKLGSENLGAINNRVKYLETGLHNPTLNFRKFVAEYFDIPETLLLYDKELPPVNNQIVDLIMEKLITPQEQSRAKSAINTIDSKKLRSILKLSYFSSFEDQSQLLGALNEKGLHIPSLESLRRSVHRAKITFANKTFIQNYVRRIRSALKDPDFNEDLKKAFLAKYDVEHNQVRRNRKAHHLHKSARATQSRAGDVEDYLQLLEQSVEALRELLPKQKVPKSSDINRARRRWASIRAGNLLKKKSPTTSESKPAMSHSEEVGQDETEGDFEQFDITEENDVIETGDEIDEPETAPASRRAPVIKHDPLLPDEVLQKIKTDLSRAAQLFIDAYHLEMRSDISNMSFIDAYDMVSNVIRNSVSRFDIEDPVERQSKLKGDLNLMLSTNFYNQKDDFYFPDDPQASAQHLAAIQLVQSAIEVAHQAGMDLGRKPESSKLKNNALFRSPKRSELRSRTAPEKVLADFLAARESYDVKTKKWEAVKGGKRGMVKNGLDLMLIMGSQDERVPVEAAKLAKLLRTENPEMKIIITGKWGTHTGVSGQFHDSDGKRISEALHYQNIMHENGVEADYLEEESVHSGENITFSRKIIDRQNLKPKRVLLIQNPMLQKRAGATFIKQYVKPGETLESLGIETVVSWSPYRYNFLSLNQDEAAQLTQIALDEFARLEAYARPENNFIEPTLISESVRRAVSDLRNPSRSELRTYLLIGVAIAIGTWAIWSLYQYFRPMRQALKEQRQIISELLSRISGLERGFFGQISLSEGREESAWEIRFYYEQIFLGLKDLETKLKRLLRLNQLELILDQSWLDWLEKVGEVFFTYEDFLAYHVGLKQRREIEPDTRLYLDVDPEAKSELRAGADPSFKNLSHPNTIIRKATADQIGKGDDVDLEALLSYLRKPGIPEHEWKPLVGEEEFDPSISRQFGRYSALYVLNWWIERDPNFYVPILKTVLDEEKSNWNDAREAELDYLYSQNSENPLGIDQELSLLQIIKLFRHWYSDMKEKSRSLTLSEQERSAFTLSKYVHRIVSILEEILKSEEAAPVLDGRFYEQAGVIALSAEHAAFDKAESRSELRLASVEFTDIDLPKGISKTGLKDVVSNSASQNMKALAGLQQGETLQVDPSDLSLIFTRTESVNEAEVSIDFRVLERNKKPVVRSVQERPSIDGLNMEISPEIFSGMRDILAGAQGLDRDVIAALQVRSELREGKVFTRNAFFGEKGNLALAGKNLSNIYGSYRVIVTNRSELRIVEEINQTIENPKNKIIPVPDYQRARAELRNLGLSMTVIGVSSDSAAVSLLERVADKVVIWNSAFVDRVLSGVADRISRFQASLQRIYTSA